MSREGKRAKLGDVCTKITDGSHNPPKGLDYSAFMMLSSKNIDFDSISYTSPRFLSETDFNEEDRRTEVQYDDVLLTIVGTIGRVAVVPNNAPRFTLQRSVAVLKPDQSVMTSRFLMYALWQMTDALNASSRGVAQKGIYLKALREIDLPVLPLPEQQRIVGILDQAFEGIAKAKANAERNLANAKELYRSEFSSILRDAKGWKEVTLPAISKNLDGKRIPITRSDRVAGEIPYYGASGIVDYVEGFIFDDDILLVSEDGANLLARSTPIAFPVQGKCWVNNHAHVLKFEDMVVQRYVERFINHISIERFVTGAAQPKLTQASLNKIPILMPTDITKTANIAERLDELSELALSLQANAKTKVKHLESLQGAILHQAFSGNL